MLVPDDGPHVFKQLGVGNGAKKKRLHKWLPLGLLASDTTKGAVFSCGVNRPHEVRMIHARKIFSPHEKASLL
jgi:hypothetical protein